MGLESSDEIAYYYGEQHLFGLSVLKPNEIIKKYKSVTPEDILRVSRRIFKNERLNCAIIGGHDKKDLASFKKVLNLS